MTDYIAATAETALHFAAIAADALGYLAALDFDPEGARPRPHHRARATLAYAADLADLAAAEVTPALAALLAVADPEALDASSPATLPDRHLDTLADALTNAGDTLDRVADLAARSWHLAAGAPAPAAIVAAAETAAEKARAACDAARVAARAARTLA